MKYIDSDNFWDAIATIERGDAKRIDVGDVKIYRCKNIIRVDIPSPDSDALPELGKNDGRMYQE